MNRRNALGLMIAAAGAALVTPAIGASKEDRRVERIGVQLYTVREPLAKDVPGTLAAIAAAGYAEVETAGHANLPPAQFAAALKQAGLVAPSAHVPLNLIESSPAQLLEMAAALGHRYLVLPSIEPARRATLAGYQQVAEVLNGFGQACAGAGVQLAYHNHDFEFVPLEGRVPYDVLLERCDSNLVKFELDLFWITKAGADAAACLRGAPERFPMCHVKDMTTSGEMVAVGDGAMNFAALFRAGSGLRHFFVEHDKPADPLDCVRRGAAALHALRY